MIKTFTPKRFLTSIAIFAMVCISVVSLTNSGGPSGGNTNAPGENNCTQCHSGTLQTSGTNFSNISFSGNFTGNGYIPDSTYTITLKYKHSGKSKFGFQLTALDNNNAMAGSFNNTNSRVGITTASISGATRSYARHTSSGNSGTDSISWTFEWTAPSTNKDTITIYSIINATNSNSNTSGDIIIAKEFKIAPSSLLPEATAGTSNSTPCQASAVSLSGSSTNNATSWQWTIPGATPNSSTAQNPSVLFTAPGAKYAILVSKNAKGFSLPDTVFMNVKAAPSSFIIGNATRTICPGDSVKIEVASQSGITYSWSTGATTTFIYAKAAGTYSVIATGANGCVRNSNIITVNEHSKPTASLSSNASVFNDSSCTNAVLTLQASSSSFDSFYYFSNNSEFARSSSATQTTTFDTTTTYGLRVKDGNGCLSDISNYTVISKQELPAPVVICNTITPSSILFSWDGSLYHDGFQVSLNKGLSWINPSSGSTGNTHLVNGLQPEDTFDLWVRAKDVAPCYYSEIGNQKCVSDTCSQLEATATYNDELCFGEMLSIEVNGLAGENYAISIDGGSTFTDTLIEFNATVSKTYVLAITDSNNLACPANELEVTVTVDKINDINLKKDKIGAYCAGETVTFTANDTIETFDFYWNNTLDQSGTSNTYVNSQMQHNDSVNVIVTKGACTDTSQYNYVIFEGPANASFSYTRSGAIYSFVPAEMSFAAYSWDFGDGSAIDNSITPTHDYSSKEGEDVTVSLEVTTDNNCVTDSTDMISLPLFSDINLIRNLGLEFYPNPVKDNLMVNNSKGKTGVIYMYSVSGELLQSIQLVGSKQVIDLHEYDSGIYIFKVSIDGKETSLQIIKN